jgi:O-antigen/teichoic acid export membrane protein
MFTSRVKRLSFEIFWVGLGQALSVIGGLVGVRLLTDLLAPDIYGELTLGLTAAAFSNQIIYGPLANSFLRFFAPAKEANQLSQYFEGIKTILTKTMFVIVGIFIPIFVFSLVIGYGKWIPLLALSLILSVLIGCNLSFDTIQNAARQRPVVALHQGAGQWLKFIVAVILINILGSFSTIALLGFIFSAATIFVSQCYFFRRIIAPLINERRLFSFSMNNNDWSRKMYSYAWPFSTFGLFTWALLSSDRWALQLFTSTSEVGLYSVLFQLGYLPMVLMSTLLTQIVLPVIFSKAGDGTDSTRTNAAYKMNVKLTVASFVLAMVVSAVTYFYHKQIFSYLVAPAYRHISMLLPFMTLASGLFMTAETAALFLTINLDTRILIKPKIVTAILGILFNLIGAYLFGIRGIVFACIGFAILYFLWISLLVGCIKNRVLNPPTLTTV